MERARERERAARGGERALERETLEVLHHDVERAVGELPGEEDLDDVRDAAGARRPSPRGEARHELRVAAELAVEDLHGDVAIDAALERAIDAAHRADADELRISMWPGDLLAEVGIVLVLAAAALGRCRALEGHAVERTEQRVRRIASAASTTHFR